MKPFIIIFYHLVIRSLRNQDGCRSKKLDVTFFHNPYPGNGKEGEYPPSAVFAENRTVSNGMRQLYCDFVIDPLGFPMQVTVSSYLLPVLRGRFDSNVHLTGFATTSIVRP